MLDAPLWQVSVVCDILLEGHVELNVALARHEDSLGYIRIWVTPPRRIVFWDGAPSPYNWYQSHAPNLACVWVVFDPPGAQKAQVRFL